MANWGIYAFPEPEPTRIKKPRLFNRSPYIENALGYYSAEFCYTDTAMNQPCSPGEGVEAIADLGILENTMISHSATKPLFLIDNGFSCIQFNGHVLLGNKTYSSNQQFLVFRAPSATFASYGAALGTTASARPYLFEQGSSCFHSNALQTKARRNGVLLADPFSSGALSPMTQIMVVYIEHNAGGVSTWQIGKHYTYTTPFFLYEVANYSGLSDDQINEIEAYLLSKYKI